MGFTDFRIERGFGALKGFAENCGTSKTTGFNEKNSGFS